MPQSGGASFAKGTVLEYLGVMAKKPNSGVRNCIKVELFRDGKIVTAKVPFDGGLNFIEINDEVLLCGIGNRQQQGVHYKVVKVNKLSLEALVSRKKRYP